MKGRNLNENKNPEAFIFLQFAYRKSWTIFICEKSLSSFSDEYQSYDVEIVERKIHLTCQSCGKSLGVESLTVNSDRKVSCLVFLSTYILFFDDYINSELSLLQDTTSQKINWRDCRTSLRVNLRSEAVDLFCNFFEIKFNSLS